MHNSTSAVAVIPARLASSRLAEKLLLRETGKTILQHTWEAARAAELTHDTIIAVDHPLLQAEAESFGATTVMTSEDCRSGGDRVAEVAARVPEPGIFVNVQGDEPEIAPEAIDEVVRLLQANPDTAMATLACPIEDEQSLQNPNNVKVVLDHSGHALYFSRAPIPFVRDPSETASAGKQIHLHHIGLYAYRRDFLTRFASLPAGPLERAEKLEQLRALENGYRIVVGIVDSSPPGIDTRADYDRFVQRYRQRHAVDR